MSAVPAFKLVEAGFSQPQVEALAEFMQTEAARRSDLLETEHRLESKIGDVRQDVVRLDGRVLLLQWMIGFVLAFLVAIFAKLFLAH
jgi:hypothetical protein